MVTPQGDFTVNVLILILLEVTQITVRNRWIFDHVSLNPYSTGSNSNAWIDRIQPQSFIGLNPYSTGSNSNNVKQVLILKK